MEKSKRIAGLAPILPHTPRLLLLGSMPSEQSIEKQQYYGHARNHFWKLLCEILYETDTEQYADRVKILHTHGIALWDSIGSCERQGSLDQHIRKETPNNIPALLQDFPSIQAVAFNGAMAEKVYDRHFARVAGIHYLRLPSSSPVPSKNYRNIEDKLPLWLALCTYIAV